jgi:hypothetical protein
MSDITYMEGIVKILERPKQKLINNDIICVKFRAQLASVRKTQIITITFWGNLAQDIVSYYKINQYILIEGYPSFRNSNNFKQTSKRIEITGLRVYPVCGKTDNLKNQL